MPTTPDPTQVFPSWATIHSGGIITTTNGLIDTNAVPSDLDGLPAGLVAGVLVAFDTNNVYTLTRGEFYALLDNSNGQFDNTRFEVKIMRNPTDFSELFHEELAAAEYETNSAGLMLTPVSGYTNLYDVTVQFPSCVCAASRVISIRTEPLDFDLPFAQMQWLVGSGGTNAPVTYTTDETGTNLVAQSSVPAIRLWGLPVVSVGLAAQNLTPGTLNLFGVPGTVIQTSSGDATGPFGDYLWPDNQGVGQADMTQSSTGFYTLRVDYDP